MANILAIGEIADGNLKKATREVTSGKKLVEPFPRLSLVKVQAD